MILSPSRKFVFVHVTKCAGTSVTHAYAPHACHDDLIIGATPEGEAVEKAGHPAGLHKHSRAAELRAFISNDVWDSYRSLTVVRNPWARLVSFYTWCRKYSHSYQICEPACSGSFQAFLRSPQVANMAKKAQMSDWVVDEDGRVIVEQILRVEDLATGLPGVMESFGLPVARLAHRNRSGSDVPWQDWYDPTDRRMVADLFERDVESFGYRFAAAA